MGGDWGRLTKMVVGGRIMMKSSAEYKATIARSQRRFKCCMRHEEGKFKNTPD